VNELAKRRELILFKRRKVELAKRRKKRGIFFSVVTVIIVAALWRYGVMPMQADLTRTRENRHTELKALQGVQSQIDRGIEIGSNLRARGELLAEREAHLAPDRDAYSWMLGMIKPCIHSRDGFVVRAYAQPEINDAGIISDFPYKWATFHLNARGYYHDFERFVSELENTLPYFRVQNAEFAGNPGPDIDSEKLEYRFDLVVPVVSSAAR
jgi:hypothetical protein